MIQYLVAVSLGILSGVITGLVPGIHPNTVIFASMPLYLTASVEQALYLSYLTGLSISHTFHDFLPAIFLSAPEAEAALSAVAAPEMVRHGKGLEAFNQTVKGGLTSVLTVVIVLAPFFLFFEQVYGFISGFMEYVLLFFLFFIVLDSENLLNAGLVAVFSGALGVISFQAPVNQQFVLVPIFSGLFAVPGITGMLRENFEVPEQDEPKNPVLDFSRGGVAGTFAGLLAGTVPGIGAAVSTSFFAPMMDNSKKDFLAAMGAVNTSDIIFSLLTLQILGKARSGVSVALKALSTPSFSQLVFLSILAVFSVAISAFLALKVSKHYWKFLERFDIEKVLYATLSMILVITLMLTGLQGVLVLATSSLIGFSARKMDERRSCMAVLIIPAIIFFAEISIFM